ncbi:unnamed protein product [Auanema sp. JU1783]|nr:unnamed protein product [Auanema sp. JU1783]
MKDNGESGRTACIEMIKEYPIEMDTLHGVNFMFTNNIEFIIAMGVVELVGVGVPVVMLGLGFVLNIGNYVVSLFSLILPCFYPIAGPYYVLMSNVDYNKRVKEIIANVRSKLCSSRANQKVTSVSSVLFGSTTS